ncbi:serine/arginine repetitive matrix protein 2-like [Dorcoceras hygrometricum]|uniref:Serine/arginine repetitive matrix protein 2-like n=1 Tax=Dorcoceras hygrometricum TaxID=472368 RepID=A0A2Z7A770_9LAMI|nr:serine/arginine repetitive matrix protein 2-like [Dorcoceras hygrometricum]
MIYVKADSFDVVTRDRFMLMTAITFDVKINWSTLLFGVLKAMVTPGSRQAKGFAIQIGVVLSNIPGLELGEPRAFPPPRVLNEKTVHRFVHINEQVGMEKTSGSPPMKKNPKKRVVSKKRPVDSDAEVAPIVKKKRTTKGKPTTIGLEAVPLQTIEPTADVPNEQPSKPKCKSQKRKRRLVLDDVDETGESETEQPAAGTATGVQETSADVPIATQPAVAPADEDQPVDDPDVIIEQILTQLDIAAATKGDDQPTAQAKESIPWFDLHFILAQRDAEGLLSSDTDEEFIADQPTDPLFPDGGDQPQVSGNSKPVTEEHMSIDDILMKISEDMMIPSVTAAEITKIRLGESISIPGVQERDLFYASLPRFSIHDKGKEILVEDEPVRGNPARETVELI